MVPIEKGDGPAGTGAVHVDDRGRLLSVDFSAVPFTVRRVFVITDVPAGTRRGGHSHRQGIQQLYCARGRVDVELRRGDGCELVTLVPDGSGLLIPSGVWSCQHYVEPGSELMVLASEPFDPTVYETEPTNGS